MLKSAVTAGLVTKLPQHVGTYDRDLHLLLGANEVDGDVQLPYILLLKATKHACYLYAIVQTVPFRVHHVF
jgi:hypothetical protein